MRIINKYSRKTLRLNSHQCVNYNMRARAGWTHPRVHLESIGTRYGAPCIAKKRKNDSRLTLRRMNEWSGQSSNTFVCVTPILLPVGPLHLFPNIMLFSKTAVTAACLVALLLVVDPVVSLAEQVEPEGDFLYAAPVKRHNEFVLLDGHKVRDNFHSPLPYTYIQKEDLPVSD